MTSLGDKEGETMRFAITFTALLTTWFVAAHLIYWFVTFEWSWLSEWKPISRGLVLGVGIYVCAFFAVLRPWRMP